MRKHSPKYSGLLFWITAAGFLVSAAGCAEEQSATLWTDRPEAAFYAQYYNAGQHKYFLKVRYTEAPLALLAKERRKKPDMILARSLHTEDFDKLFQDVRPLLKKNRIDQHTFYAAALAYGRRKNRQFLLPVSFNIPAIAFLKDSYAPPENTFTLDLHTVKNAGIAYNEFDGAVPVRLGFSPLWDKNDAFVILVTRLYNVRFAQAHTEGNKQPALPLTWDNDALTASLQFLRGWLAESSGTIQTEEDFFYKYFFDPAQKLLLDKRILFAALQSGDYFTLKADYMDALDFRWLSYQDRVPILDGIVELGIYRKARAKKAAEDFIRWFFTEETQDFLLKKSKENHLDDGLFGIAGGFSAMKTVSEFVFPKYYRALLGHVPPSELLAPPDPPPHAWNEIKEEVIRPYLLAEIRQEGGGRTLEELLANWLKIKQGRF